MSVSRGITAGPVVTVTAALTLVADVLGIGVASTGSAAAAETPSHLYAIVCPTTASCQPDGLQRIVQTDLHGHSAKAIGSDVNTLLGLAISPDGTRIAFSKKSGYLHVLTVRDVASGKDTQLTGQDPNCDSFTYATQPAWSPDGRYLTYDQSSSFGSSHCPTDGVYMRDMSSNTTRRLNVRGGGEATWSRDAKSISLNGVASVSVATFGAGERVLRSYPSSSEHMVNQVAWGPTGTTILVGRDTDVFGLAPDGKLRWDIKRSSAAYYWSADGASLYAIPPGSTSPTVVTRLDAKAPGTV
ncbi:MAG: amidohydrolase, partial [Frankiales bacterium]|nr:amidohydrolase [Frankiales bacterium]